MNSTSETDTLTRTLSAVGAQIEPDSDWDRLVADISHGETGSPTKLSSKRPRILAAAAALFAFGAGGSALSIIAETEPTDISATKPNYVLPGEIVLMEDPLVVAGVRSPEPRFDTSGLGRQILIEPVNAIDGGLDRSIMRAVSLAIFGDKSRTTTKVTIVGRIEGDPWFIIVTDGPNIDGVGGFPVDENLRQRSVSGPSGGGGGGDIVPIASLEFIEPQIPTTSEDPLPFGYSFPEGWVNLSQLPIGTSVVSFSDADTDLWLIPSAGVAAFPAEFEEGERFHLRAFDVEGELIASVSQTATSGG